MFLLKSLISGREKLELIDNLYQEAASSVGSRKETPINLNFIAKVMTSSEIR